MCGVMRQPDVIVRLIPAEEPALSSLIALSDSFLASLYPAESNHLESLAALAAPNVAVFGAYVGGELVGCVASKCCEGDQSYAEVKRLFILDSHRGKGIAKLLMRHLEDDVRGKSILLVRLETGVRQPAAIGLYASLGYVSRGPFGSYKADPMSVFMEKRIGA